MLFMERKRIILANAKYASLFLLLLATLFAFVSSSGSFYLEEPKDVTAFEGEDVTFSCRYPRIANATCMFTFKRKYLLASKENGTEFGYYETGGYCALTVRQVSGDQDGSDFQCLIVDPIDSGMEQSNMAYLHVLIPPKSLQMSISIDDDDSEVLPDGSIQIVAGDTVDFTCQAVGARPAVHIDWYLNERLLSPEFYTQLKEVSQNEVYDTHSTLSLSVSQQENNAMLRCATKLQENVAEVLQETKVLKVLYPPTEVYLNSADLQLPVKVGDEVTVSCYCDNGNPFPVLTLFKGSKEVNAIKKVDKNQVSIEFKFVAEQDDHNARFTCQAKSSAVEHAPIVSEQRLQVYFKPASVEIEGYNRAIYAGDIVALECKTDWSYPASKIVWTLNGKEVGYSQDKVSGNSSHGYVTTSLYEVLVDDDSISTVACEAQNQQFPDVVTRDTVELQIQYMPSVPTLSVDPLNTDNTYREEDSVRLSCVSTGRPTPTISWYRDGAFLDSGAQLVSAEDFTVRYSFSLSRLSRDDHGKRFSCSAHNVVVGPDETPPTSSITFKIYYPPTSVTISSNVEKPFIENKQGIEFTCTTDVMNPNSVIFEWFINGVPVNSANTESKDPITKSNGFILSNKMKIIRLIDKRDHNIPVTCKVTPVEFPALIVSDTYHMEVYYEPILKSNVPLRVTVNESSKAVLDCGQAETNPVIAFYQWSGAKVIQSPGSKLEFERTSRNDAGEYFCKACNCDTPNNFDLCPWTACSSRRKIVLQVEYAPELLASNNLLEVDIGSHAVLKCTQRANPPGQVYWMFEDQVIDPHSSHLKYNISADPRTQISMLTIESVVQSDAGHYSCGVVNKLGDDQVIMQLAVKHAPYFESKENTNLVVSGRAGESSAVLFCVANGYPELSFDWINYPNDQSTTKRVVQLSPSKWRSELTINPIRGNSFGNYTCTAKNNMGAGTWRVELSKPRAPEKPRKFVIQETSHSSQTFKWISGFDGGYPQTFEILHQVLGKENEGWKIASVKSSCTESGSVCNFTVSKLASATTYTFKVCSHNRVGPMNRDDACSELIQATTYAAPVLSAERSFREMPLWLMIALPSLTGMFIVTNLIFLALYCRKRFFKKNRADERPFSISTQSSSRADHGMLYHDSYYYPAGSDRYQPGTGSDIGDNKDHRFFNNYSSSPPLMNPIDLFERGTAASTHSDDVTSRMHVSNEFDPACRINPGLAPAGYPLYLTGNPATRGSAQWPGGIMGRPVCYDQNGAPLNNEEMYKNQIRQKSRQGNRNGESYFSGESRSSTPIQSPVISTFTASNNHPQEPNAMLSRYDSLPESHQESNSDCTNIEGSGRGSGCNLTANSISNQEHQSSLYSKKL